MDRRSLLRAMATTSLAATSAAIVPSFFSREAHAAPPRGPLLWGTDFNTFDSTKWRKGPDGWSDRYGDINYWDPNLVSIVDSKLRLRVEKRGGVWAGGLVHTRDRIAWTYGYFEIRAKVPAGQGLWSALWLMPALNRYGYWPHSGEIDILEHLGKTGEVTNGYSTIHFANGGGAHEQRFRVATGRDWSQDWHTWGCLWDKTPDGREYFRFYVDDVQYGEITEQEWPARGRELGAPFNQAFYVIFNLAVGGPWAGPAGLSVSGKYLEIDWVRVYRAP